LGSVELRVSERWKKETLRDGSGRRIGERWTKNADRLQTYETEQPWITYLYLTTDRRTRVTGRSRIRCTCCVCGKRRTLTLRIPRVGPIVDRGRHPERVRFLLDHLHSDKPHPMAWALPLLNPAAHVDGIDLDLLRMRLEAGLTSDSPHSQEDGR
jgi:hypothetical protein